MVENVSTVDPVPSHQVGVCPAVVNHGKRVDVGVVDGVEVEDDKGTNYRSTPQSDEGVDQGGQTIAIHSSTSFPHL